MALDWKPTSSWWYARFTFFHTPAAAEGQPKPAPVRRSKQFRLGVKIEGRRPDRIHASGPGVDPAFIRSRAEALKAHDRLKDEIGIDRTEIEERQKLIELKTGRRVEASALLADMPDAWASIPRRSPPSSQHLEQSRKTIRRYGEFIRERWPGVEELAATTCEHAAAFMAAEDARGVSPKTWNDTLQLLRGVYRRFQPEADAFRRYLATTPTRRTETVNRKPFSPEELGAILESAKVDPLARSLIVAGVCTAMRRGDVCLLKWADVDLAAGFLTVRTAKTGQTVSIPIFPLLADELTALRGTGGEYVFPEAAHIYRTNPQGITWRVKKILAAVFGPGAGVAGGEPDPLPEHPPEETRKRGLAYLDTLRQESKKTARMRRTFNAYMDGTPTNELRAEQGIGKAILSQYLSEIEAGAGCRVVRGRHRGISTTAVLRADGESLRKSRGEGQRRASVRDFHSFRVTWVTLALTAGVPLELVQKVTGHKTVEVVLSHYFQPGRDAFRKAILGAMPDLLTRPGGTAPEASPTAKTKEERLRDAIGAGETDPARLLAILDGNG